MDVVVFGAGSLGSLVGAVLSRRHDVTLVGRAPHVEAVDAEGLRVTGVESFVAHPAATTEGTGLTADLAVVTVKAFDTAAAAEALATGDVSAVLSLGNGMGNEATLADRLDAPVVAGTTALGAALEAPGRVAWLGRGETAVGPWADGGTEDGSAGDRGESAARAARRAGAALRVAGLPTTVTGAIRERLWEKLAANAAINPLTALGGVRNGAVFDPPLDGVAAAAAREAAAAARASGVALSDGTAVGAARRVARATADNRSSMAQDLAAGRRTEVDAINGHVVEALGADAAPVNATLAALVRAREGDRSGGGTGDV
ncbi:MAG: ketopantoate reductase family protein [Haloferacaceae archaeon]